MENYFTGSLIGMSNILIGFPLDTIKCRLQYNNYNQRIYNNLYDGIKYPLISSCITNFLRYGIFIEMKQHNNILDTCMITSCLTAPISNYFDVKKIKIQNQIYNNILSIKSFPFTYLHEFGGLYLYFSSYEYCKNNTNIPMYIAGGLYGQIYTLSIYPLDTLKTRIQSGYSFKNAIKKKNLYHGLKFSLCRSFIINAISFKILYSINF
jgi:hypothetical protein